MAFQINKEDVFKAYSGASGCMCGCNRRYSLGSADDIAAGNENTGYEAYDESSVRPRSISIAVTKINAALAAGDEDAGVEIDKDGEVQFAWLDNGNRNTVVYFRNYILKQNEASRARKAAA